MRKRQAEVQKKNEQLKGQLRESQESEKAIAADFKACNLLLDQTKSVLKARDADAVLFREKARDLSSRLGEAARSAAEAEAELVKVTASLEGAKAESETQYNKGFDDAGASYLGQVKEITERLFCEGWKAALRVQGVDKSSALWTAVPLRSDADLGSDAEADDEESSPGDAEVPAESPSSNPAVAIPSAIVIEAAAAEAAEVLVVEAAEAAEVLVAEAAEAETAEPAFGPANAGL